jgi:hypothetical protein
MTYLGLKGQQTLKVRYQTPAKALKKTETVFKVVDLLIGAESRIELLDHRKYHLIVFKREWVEEQYC